jgi:hypothetical protein
MAITLSQMVHKRAVDRTTVDELKRCLVAAIEAYELEVSRAAKNQPSTGSS